MKHSLYPTVNGIRLFVLLAILISCESQQMSNEDIQSKILQDEDFIDMMTEVFIVKLEDNSDAHRLANFNSNFEILNKRYQDFNSNVQKALADKGTAVYNSYAVRLYNRILSILSETSSKIAVAYDGPSVCGRPNCGGSGEQEISYKNAIATSCITGAYYSELYCITHNMGQCEEMLGATVNFCCDSYCSANVE
jgi:hypothetical protein